MADRLKGGGFSGIIVRKMASVRPQPCSLKQIAREAGVSVDTVSRVLNGKIKGLRRDAVARAKMITELAERYNYRPHASARSLQAKRFFTLGYFNTAIWSEPSHGQILFEPGVYWAAARMGYSLTYMQAMADMPSQDPAIPKSLRESSMDGLIVSHGSAIASAWHDIFSRLDVPLVHINHQQKYNAVYHDDLEAALRLTRFFLDRGMTRIAYVQGVSRSDCPHYSEVDRIAGYQKAMADAGLPWDVRFLATSNCRLTPESFAEMAAWLSDPATRPQAVICHEDTSNCFRFQQVLIRLGLRAPQDLWLGSFGYGLISPDSPMPLVSMAIPHLPIADAAVAMLVQMIQESRPRMPSQIFSSRLVVYPELQGL